MKIKYPAHKACHSDNWRKPWTQVEEERLTHLIDRDKLSFAKVAGILVRTYAAIQERRSILLRKKWAQMKKFYNL